MIFYTCLSSSSCSTYLPSNRDLRMPVFFLKAAVKQRQSLRSIWSILSNQTPYTDLKINQLLVTSHPGNMSRVLGRPFESYAFQPSRSGTCHGSRVYGPILEDLVLSPLRRHFIKIVSFSFRMMYIEENPSLMIQQQIHLPQLPSWGSAG